jgi:SNF2 family DNA or RNA helicase
MITDKAKFGPFQYRTTPYKHQDEIFLKSRDLIAYGLFWEMGTGKSKPFIDTMAWLFLKGEIDGVIVVSDKGAYLNWEIEEIPRHMPNIPYRIGHWNSHMRKAEQAVMERLMVAQDNTLDILCVNIEALSSERATLAVERFIKNHYCLMIIDESTSIKNPKAQRTLSAWKLGAQCDYRRIATGTPITQSPLDLFAQCQFLKPGLIGCNSFTAFRSYYATTILQSFGGRKPFLQITGYKNLDHLNRILQSFSSRILKTQCLDLPDKVYETLVIEHTPEQAAMYESLKRTAIIQLEQGLLTSTSALTTINKLMQINCGHVKLDDGTLLDVPSNRVNITVDLLETLGNEKVIIWCAYQRDVQLLLAEIKQRKLDGYAVHYYGLTTTEERAEHLRRFHTDPRCQWFIGTAATGGKALTLVEANKTIYYSNTYQLEDRLQSEDRNHRIGQTNKVTYIDMVCPGTIDQKVLASLKTKQDLASQVLDRFRELV